MQYLQAGISSNLVKRAAQVFRAPLSCEPSVPWIWRCVGVILFGLAWLIPPGNSPWNVFLRECSVSGLTVLVGLAIALRVTGRVQLTPLALAALALALTPLMQWGFGLITVAGGAWITSAYLAGFALCIGCGALWDRADPGAMVDALFQAICLAALATVCIQCYQWLHPSEVAGPWLAYTPQTRLAGNFGQPNHTATFLLWGVCAIAWLWVRGYVKSWVALVLSAIFLTGVAFAVSRTAWLGLALILCLSWYWRALWPDKRTPWIVAALCVYFIAVSTVAVTILQPNYGALDVLASSSSGLARLQIWHIAVKALALKPWLGYGWGQIFAAQLAVAAEAPQLHHPLNSAHNLVLDVLLCCGLLIGGLALCAGAHWLWRCVQKVDRAQEALLVIFVLIALNHAMLEYPLRFAYLLLPFGLVLGALDARLSPWKVPALQVPKVAWIGALAVAALLWGLILKDYFSYQDSYQDLVLHRLGIATEPWEPSKVILLNQLSARLELEGLDAMRKDRSVVDLEAFESVAALTPVGGSMVLLAGSLAMNGYPERARSWLASFCSVYSEAACTTARAKWKKAGEQYPEFGAIPWPEN